MNEYRDKEIKKYLKRVRRERFIARYRNVSLFLVVVAAALSLWIATVN